MPQPLQAQLCRFNCWGKCALRRPVLECLRFTLMFSWLTLCCANVNTWQRSTSETAGQVGMS